MSTLPLTKPKPMWAYVTIFNGTDEIHCYTSERKARSFWAEHGPSKRIRKVWVSLEKRIPHSR